MSCHNCKNSILNKEKFGVCKQCKLAIYCNSECQNDHWKIHKEFCEPIGSNYIHIEPSDNDPDPNNYRLVPVPRADGSLGKMIITLGAVSSSKTNWEWATRFFNSMRLVVMAYRDKLENLKEKSENEISSRLQEYAVLRNLTEQTRMAEDKILRGNGMSEYILNVWRKNRGDGKEENEFSISLESWLSIRIKVQNLLISIEFLLFNEEEDSPNPIRPGSIKPTIALMYDWDTKSSSPFPMDTYRPSQNEGPIPRPKDIKGNTTNQKRTKRISESRVEWIDRLINRLEELNNLIGLRDAKRNIREFISSFLLSPAQFLDRHLNIAMWGEPGTGKTEVGRRIGTIMHLLGFLPNDPGEEFNELDSTNFVGSFTGQTAPKTKNTIIKSLGEVMFVDEAYNINPKSPEDGSNASSFGIEAVNAIVLSLSQFKGLVVMVIAGYEENIKESLFQANPGFERRFPDQWNFPPYTADELYEIWRFKLNSKDVSIDKEEAFSIEESVQSLIRDLHAKGKFESQNAGGIDIIINQAIRIFTSRVSNDLLDRKLGWNAMQVNQVILTEFDIETAFASYSKQKNLNTWKKLNGLQSRQPSSPVKVVPSTPQQITPVKKKATKKTKKSRRGRGRPPKNKGKQQLEGNDNSN